ncbi:hypothetical protein L1049_027923 [Liquidambar formosana]|uniref:Uncharacterized protein n=1 Tax=Liquidambar formosana TaxID=63359 RepID=A0AAP0RJG4_LIQFO
MDITRLKALFFSIISIMFRFLPNIDPQQLPPPPPPPPPPASGGDLEVSAKHNLQPASPIVVNNQNINRDWAKIIIAFCLTAAVDIALLPVQTHSQLPTTFYFPSLSMSFAFASLFVAQFIGAKYPVAARVLDRIGVFFAATTFFLAISIPFPLSLKCTTWTLYVLALLVIIICHCI